MNHFLRLGKQFLLAGMLLLSCVGGKAITYDEWESIFQENYVPSYSTVAYVIDDEMRNGGISAHMWERTENADGTVTDAPYADWSERVALSCTGYQYEDENGKQHPIYRLIINEWFDYVAYRQRAVTHLIFVQGDKSISSTYEYKRFGIYKLGQQEGYSGEERTWDFYNRVTPMTEGKYTVYFAYRSNYSGPNPQDFSWSTNYHYDKNYNAVYPKVHVWGDQGDLTPYAFNEEMTAPSAPNKEWTYVKYKYGYSYFYEYNFYYFGGDPSGILFHLTYSQSTGDYDEENNYVEKLRNLSYYTGDLTFQNNAVYYYDGQKVVTEPEEAQFFDQVPETESTFYFADTDNWFNYNEWNGQGSITVYADGIVNNDANSAWFCNIQADPHYIKYIKINDKWCQVYKLTFKAQYNGIIKNITLRRMGNSSRQTYSYESLDENCLVYYGGNGVQTPILTDFEDQLVDEIPEEATTPRSATIYVNLGANQLMETDLWRPPYCHPYKRSAGDNVASDYTFYNLVPPPVDNEMVWNEDQRAQLAAEQMTMLAPGFYSYTIEDVTKIDDVVLYYYAEDKAENGYDYVYAKDDDGNEILDNYGYPVVEEVIPKYNYFPNVFVLPASRSPHNDPTELTKYVFDIGVDCIHQSYITYDQLSAIEAVPLAEQPYLYIAGNETVDSDNSGDDPIRAKAIANDHGCFFADFEVGEDAPAVYKFSTIDVASTYDALDRGRDYYDYQRGWATYNQGIVGCHIDPERADYEDWYEQHVVRPDGSPSRMVSININECLDYNRYCQYPWRVEYDPTGQTGVKYPGHYWFVVDFNDDDQTVVLLDFDPHPYLYSVPRDVRQIDIASAEAAEALHNGVYPKASDYNGKIMHERVNVASGAIDVKGTGNQAILDAGFDVVYTVFTENGTIVFEGKPEEISADFMALSQHTGLSVQGRFHYQYYDELLQQDVHKYFRTRYCAGEVDLSELNLPAPDISHTDQKLYMYMSGDDLSDLTIGGLVNFKYSVDRSDLFAFQPGYEVTSATVNGEAVENVSAPLLHKDHFVNNNANPWGNWLGIDADTPWQPHDGISTQVAANHWGNYIVNSADGNMPMLFDRLALIDDFDLATCSAECSLEFAAHYPFLSHRQGCIISVRPLNVRAKEPGAAEAIPADIANYKMDVVDTFTPYTVNFDDNVITGVESIASDAAGSDCDAVYYNISGMRIPAASLTPGIYIEARGARTRKIIVK